MAEIIVGQQDKRLPKPMGFKPKSVLKVGDTVIVRKRPPYTSKFVDSMVGRIGKVKRVSKLYDGDPFFIISLNSPFVFQDGLTKKEFSFFRNSLVRAYEETESV